MKTIGHLLPSVAILLALSSFASCSRTRGVLLFPGNGAEGVNVDTHLTLAFDEPPTLGTSGWIRIFEAGTGVCVDSLEVISVASTAKR